MKIKLRFIVMYIFFILIFQELFFRFFFPLPEIKNFNRKNYMPAFGEVDNYSNIRSINIIFNSSPDKAIFTHKLNLYGFRDHNWKSKKKQKIPRIFFIGDSFIEGAMADDDQTISKGFFKAAAKQKQKIETMNLGVMGANPEHYMQLINDATKIFKPDYIFLFFYANDFPCSPFQLNNFEPIFFNKAKPRLIELFSLFQNNDLLPFRWSIKKIKFNAEIPSPRNPWTNKTKQLETLVEPDIASAIKNGDFNPFLIGYSAYLEKILKTPANCEDLLKRLKSHLNTFNTKLFVIYIPDRAQVTNYYKKFEKRYNLNLPLNIDMTKDNYQIHGKSLKEYCAKLNLSFLDFTPLFLEEEIKGNHLYWNYDNHMLGKSYLMIGDKIFHWSKIGDI